MIDDVGYWTEIKLDIIEAYGTEYSKILSKQSNIKGFIYIDAFAGPGVHKSRKSNSLILGSPMKVLGIEPRFTEYHFIDLNGDKIDILKSLIQEKGYKDRIDFYKEDCNQILEKKIFPRALWSDFKRALCILDPYGLHLDWRVIKKAGEMGSIEIFLNFPVADMNRNVLWHDSDAVSQEQKQRMTRFWGDESWREAAYHKDSTLFGDIDIKNTNEIIAESFRNRLINTAGFKFVPIPMPMRNSTGAVVYYLFFASQKPVGEKIVKSIFNKYGKRGSKFGN